MPTPVSARPARSRLYPWYDSLWLEDYSRAKSIIRKFRPDVLPAFETAMAVFRTRHDFRVKAFERVFDDDTLDKIRQAVRALKPAEMELHEARQFKRLLVHDHPYFTALQQELTALVSESAGEAVEPRYNFLSLYTAMGVCPVHMDAPEAKWTLDLCLNQSEPWPIYFSQIQPWPEVDPDVAPHTWALDDWDQKILQSHGNVFQSHVLQPGQAILFSGSSQWHYRNAMPSGGRQSHCDLLFFHFIPKGTSELVQPDNWARLFEVPELSTRI
jgi:hypothetical protein